MLSNCLEDGEKVIALGKCCVKLDFGCYCFGVRNDVRINRPNPQYVFIKKDKITKNDVFAALDERYVNDPENFPDCNHIFLEDLVRTEGSRIQWEPWMGS